MVIEVLYVPGCPNHKSAIHSLKDVLRSATIDAPIQEIPVMDEAMASRLKFPGSPTIRIDGSDVESNHRSPTALRADSIRTELGFHLVKSWSGHLLKHRRERSENMGSTDITRNPIHTPETGCTQGSLLQLTFVNVLLVHSWVLCGIRFTQRRRSQFCSLRRLAVLPIGLRIAPITAASPPGYFWPGQWSFANRYWRDSNRATLRLAIRGSRNCALVHSRVAIC